VVMSFLNQFSQNEPKSRKRRGMGSTSDSSGVIEGLRVPAILESHEYRRHVASDATGCLK
jgi:hypothetical protein